MEKEISEKIEFLAQEYETAGFLDGDPSKFMHRFSEVREQEAAAFIAANLAFGRREQILSHVEMILEAAGKSPVNWILSEGYKEFFPQNQKSFYRMYTNTDMLLFFDGLKRIFKSGKTAGEFFEQKWSENCSAEKPLFLHEVVAGHFDQNCALLPHSKDSAAKKVNMLLRWLVRENSPVDLGLWKWFSKKNLLMPLDTHVMQQATELGLLKGVEGKDGKLRPKSANIRTAVELTKKMSEIFPDDPVKADFALFGLGVHSASLK